MPREILIGTGFYATRDSHREREIFLSQAWVPNTKADPYKIVCIDNSELGLSGYGCRVVHVLGNLGHVQNPGSKPTRLMGWSMSWIISAMIAYSEGCDFVYKEQDCLAFGDWLPIVRRGKMSYGRSDLLPCEQSLFYVRWDYILTAVQLYLALDRDDSDLLPEYKFMALGGEFHDLPGGRNRPLPELFRPFYLQQIQPHEMELLRKEKLL